MKSSTKTSLVKTGMSDLSVLTLFLHPRLQCNVVHVHLTKMPAYTWSLKNTAVSSLSNKVAWRRIKFNRFSLCVLRSRIIGQYAELQNHIWRHAILQAVHILLCLHGRHTGHICFSCPSRSDRNSEWSDGQFNQCIRISHLSLSISDMAKFVSSDYPSPLWPGNY